MVEPTYIESGLRPVISYIVIFTLIVIAFVWELIWKGIALWRCGRNKHLAWFIVIFIVNTLGILPIIYLLFYDKKR